jgi:hypothetical protein
MFPYIRGRRDFNQLKTILDLTPIPKDGFSLNSTYKKANFPFGHQQNYIQWSHILFNN